MSRKTQQLQIRVSPEEKKAIQHQAERVGLGLSAYVLARALPEMESRFNEILDGVMRDSEDRRFWLAELNDFLTDLPPADFCDAVEDTDLGGLSLYLQNYVAAMTEQAAKQKGIEPPAWTRTISPLEEPYFAGQLVGLRPHLLRASPVAFKRRNLFVDSSVGDRV